MVEALPRVVRPVTVRRPEIAEVAEVEVAVKYEPMIALPKMSPATLNFWPGEVVPIPTLPSVVAK